MKQGSLFSGKRFFSLLRQHIFHNYMALLLGLVVGFGISFLVIAFLQFLNGNNQSSNNEFLIMLIFGYAFLGGFYISSAFSPFRNKERAQTYLMTPGTTFEKYLVEFIFYPLLYLLAFPILYLIAYELSSSLISIFKDGFLPFDLLDKINSEFLFSEEFMYKDGVKIIIEERPYWKLVASISFSLAMAFFLGAASFKKYAMLKTLLGLAVYFGLCLWMFFWLISELEWGQYSLSSHQSYLTPFGTGGVDQQKLINFFSIWILCWGLVLGVVTYLKLREKEV
ncbi:hypothetical protein LZ575_05740 [Antarcticibacterium sp. 1MA-6-2]|uniref:hypothetical protein n=1 Tax=Antarcticibacterium sp. 1MA-6-2 TaxID=2908210 RepID=UPI001F342B7C|nr:hypothetical protein [Antarcticibacterium sp. 1MA-6-2]UJH92101.1 hypothetical protein LZ575_05740 [Antarcticibacterium sp. 1MA-6-2]